MMSSTRAVGELKQQGAAEVARDPDSKVTSEDAEQVMINETKKAGGAAFQFDPNASPEEKAAQARSVSHLLKRELSGHITDLHLTSTFLLDFITRRSPRALESRRTS